MKEFRFKEEDKEGLKTLETISKADKFNRCMFDIIYPYCKGKILEIGSGIGNVSQFFIEANASISLSDIRENYCNQLKERFFDSPALDEVLLIDLTNPDFENRYQEYEKTYDTIFALNVIEHIEDDALAIKNCHFLLKDGGTLLVLVPAYQSLYCRFDFELGHFRRYTKKTLSKIFEINNFHVKHSQYFNMIGILGWIFSGKILRKKRIPEGQMGMFNKLVPLFKIIDKTFQQAFGLSVIMVGNK